MKIIFVYFSFSLFEIALFLWIKGFITAGFNLVWWSATLCWTQRGAAGGEKVCVCNNNINMNINTDQTAASFGLWLLICESQTQQRQTLCFYSHQRNWYAQRRSPHLPSPDTNTYTQSYIVCWTEKLKLWETAPKGNIFDVWLQRALLLSVALNCPAGEQVVFTSFISSVTSSLFLSLGMEPMKRRQLFRLTQTPMNFPGLISWLSSVWMALCADSLHHNQYSPKLNNHSQSFDTRDPEELHGFTK